jgi:hypothetical protein
MAIMEDETPGVYRFEYELGKFTYRKWTGTLWFDNSHELLLALKRTSSSLPQDYYERSVKLAHSIEWICDLNGNSAREPQQIQLDLF